MSQSKTNMVHKFWFAANTNINGKGTRICLPDV